MSRTVLLPTIAFAAILVFATGYAHASEPLPPIGIPSLNEWGTIAFGAVLAAAGLFNIFRRK